MKTLFLCPLVALALAMPVQSEDVTLLLNSVPNQPQRLEDSFTLEAYQTAELVSHYARSSTTLDVIRPEVTFSYAGDSNNRFGDLGPDRPLVVTGPATIRLFTWDTHRIAFATFRVTPQAFDPTKTAIVLPGTNGANVTLECSTDLMSWQTATNGLYISLPEAKFFRIRVDRVEQSEAAE